MTNLLSEKGLEDGGGESHEVLGREKVEDAVIKMIMENQDNNKQTGLGEVGSRLVSLYPDFDVRSYGYSSLSKFFEEFDRIQLVKHGHVAWVTLKENRPGLYPLILASGKPTNKLRISENTPV